MRSQTDVDSEVTEREVQLDELENLPMVRHRQYLDFITGLCRRIFDIPFAVVHPPVLHAEPHHHFQNNENVLHRLDAESAVQFP